MPNSTILLLIADEQLSDLLERAVLKPAGYHVVQVKDSTSAKAIIRSSPVDAIVIEYGIGGGEFQIVKEFGHTFLGVPLIIISNLKDEDLYIKALRHRVFEFLMPPLKPEIILNTVQQAIEHKAKLNDWARGRFKKNTDLLRRRVNVLETMSNVGRSITASLDLDEVLKLVVDAAVDITGAEEGSLLILDESTGELHMRAARNFQDEFVRTFSLPINDTLAGDVVRTGKPAILDEQSPKKIKTSYLVKSLIYVPLKIQDRVIGVLGVDNRESGHPLEAQHLTSVSALADYAAIAIENARLYSGTEVERNKLEAILTRIEDGVIVIGLDGKIVLVNRVARGIFDIGDQEVSQKLINEVIHHEQFLELIKTGNETFPYRSEIEIGEGRVIEAKLNFTHDVGMTVTLHDVTYFKELDRIKSDFVSTVSHDLRSPLTAILGYVELLERVGPISERQQGFIRRVQTSVRNITELINDLLDLGRIESGFDERMVSLSLPKVIQYSVESMKNKIQENEYQLDVDVPEYLPNILGDSVRLRQVIDNLLGNALRYTPKGGRITISAVNENDQIILRVSDEGCGIPAEDRPHIFEKFYRASNVVENISGSGLGLAIVKSIVENHQGRVWVDSVEEEGSTFTVVLPIEKST